MTALDPARLIARLADELPPRLKGHAFIVGSLAAAYHYRAQLRRRAVNTKDADLLVHPAGDVASSRALALELLALGWRHREAGRPSAAPHDTLRAIRLLPPRGSGYYVELIGLPGPRQVKPLVWSPVKLPDGWHGIPSFRCMRVIGTERQRSREGIDYAAPSMMALANLLAHREVGVQTMSAPIGGRTLLRSAKDLGRVLALAWLEGRDGAAAWREPWIRALKAGFPTRWKTLARGLGSGLDELLSRPEALEDARVSVEVGLLAGHGVTLDNLRAVGEQLRSDLLDPMKSL